MIVGPLEGAFLKMMTQWCGRPACWRSGCSPAIARSVLQKRYRRDGTVLTCEINEESAALALQYFARSPIGKKIEIRMGPALDTMRDLKGPFDLIFIDADKINYVNYYRRALDLAVVAGGDSDR